MTPGTRATYSLVEQHNSYGKKKLNIYEHEVQVIENKGTGFVTVRFRNGREKLVNVEKLKEKR